VDNLNYMLDNNTNIVNALNNLFLSGSISEDDFYRGMLVAANLFAKDGDMLAALATVAAAPLKYFDTVLYAQMEEDEEFGRVVMELASKIDLYKLLENQELKTNQPKAEA